MKKIERFFKGSGLLPLLLIGFLVFWLLSKLGVFNLISFIKNLFGGSSDSGTTAQTSLISSINKVIPPSPSYTSQANQLATLMDVDRYDIWSSDFWNNLLPDANQTQVANLIEAMSNAEIAGVVAAYGTRVLGKREGIIDWLNGKPLTLPEQITKSFSDPLRTSLLNQINSALSNFQ